MTLAAMLVEDEPFARDDLCEIIAQFPEIEVRWKVATVAEASAILAKHSPDVIYLDVQLRDGDAFELIGAIPEQTKIVFVTGFDSYAVRAFDVNALDYLLKPVEIERFEQSLRRLLGKLPPEAAGNPLLSARSCSRQAWKKARLRLARFRGDGGLSWRKLHRAMLK